MFVSKSTSAAPTFTEISENRKEFLNRVLPADINGDIVNCVERHRRFFPEQVRLATTIQVVYDRVIAHSRPLRQFRLDAMGLISIDFDFMTGTRLDDITIMMPTPS